MTRGRFWRWGVVLPATLACLAGVVADVVTNTLFYWWLLVPAYVVMFIANWRDSGRWWNPPPSPAPRAPLLVEHVASFNPFSALLNGVRWLLRLLCVYMQTFIYALFIEAVIAFLTWAKPYWQVYVPILVVLAVIAWLIWREGAPRARRRRPPQDRDHAPSHDARAEG